MPTMFGELQIDKVHVLIANFPQDRFLGVPWHFFSF
jgi:hypothetical protein